MLTTGENGMIHIYTSHLINKVKVCIEGQFPPAPALMSFEAQRYVKKPYDRDLIIHQIDLCTASQNKVTASKTTEKIQREPLSHQPRKSKVEPPCRLKMLLWYK